MRITGISVKLHTIALERPFITALRRVDAVESIRVTLQSDNGLSGEGEAPPTEAITGESAQSITETLTQRIAPLFDGRSFTALDEAIALLHTKVSGNSSARAAFDMALYDLFAKAAHQPLHAFLGADACTLQTDVTISLNTPQQMARDAADAVSQGRNILKVKVGGSDGLDVERVRRVRDAAADATLLIDANQAWSVEESLEIIPALVPFNVTLIEQPVVAEDLDGLKTITQNSPIPILADEAAFTLDDVKQIIETKAAHMINIKLMKCGGVSKALEILEYCRDSGVTCMMGSMLEGPLSISAALHLGMAYPETIRFFDLDSPLLYRSGEHQEFIGVEENRLAVVHKTGI